MYVQFVFGLRCRKCVEVSQSLGSVEGVEVTGSLGNMAVEPKSLLHFLHGFGECWSSRVAAQVMLLL